jgi:hypothetical protein
MDAFVLNTKNYAASEYDNYPFDSMCEIGGRVFAVGPGGLYELTGSSDAGVAISAEARLGASKFKTEKLKRVPAAFANLTGGPMLIKSITPASDGSKVERWYSMRAVSGAVKRHTRADLGPGIKATYWQLALANKDGADFEVDNLRLVVDELNREV